jgi:hypothetical protein
MTTPSETEKQLFVARLLAGTPRSLVEFEVLIEALTQFVENNGDLGDDESIEHVLPGWRVKTAAAQAMLDRCVAEICKAAA